MKKRCMDNKHIEFLKRNKLIGYIVDNQGVVINENTNLVRENSRYVLRKNRE